MSEPWRCGGGEWFAVLADSEASAAAADVLRPFAARVIEHATGRPWLMGCWPDGEVTCAGAGAARVAVAGECPATAARLRERLAGVRSVREASAVASGLPGSFHLMVSLGGQVRVQGTLAAVRRVFHARVAGSVVACDRAEVLARLAGAAWDRQWLALRLAGVVMPFPLHESTPWHGVRAVPSDHWLHLEPGGAARERRRWRPPEPVASLGEGARAVRAALEAAVEVRTAAGGTVSTDFSGGMDSTSLAFLASRGRAGVVTYRREDGNPFNQDAHFARAAAGRLAGARHRVVAPDEGPAVFAGLSPRAAAEGGDAGEPFGWVANQARVLYDARVLCGEGSRVHLSGYGGDELFQPGGFTHVHDLVRCRLRTAVRQARDYRLLARCSWPAMWRALADRRTPAQELAAAARALTTGVPQEGSVRATWTFPVLMPPWASRDAVEAARELLARCATREPEPLARWRAQHEALYLARCSGLSFAQCSRISRRAGLPLSAPYLDDAVVEAALAVAPQERVQPRRYKPLLAEAVRGLVPGEITDRTSKGEFSAGAIDGFARHRGDLIALLTDTRLARHGLVEPHRLRAIVERPAPDAAATQPLDATLACEAWLRALELDTHLPMVSARPRAPSAGATQQQSPGAPE